MSHATAPARVRTARPARFSRRCVQCRSYVTPAGATAGDVERWWDGIPNYAYSFACDWCHNPARAGDWD